MARSHDAGTRAAAGEKGSARELGVGPHPPFPFPPLLYSPEGVGVWALAPRGRGVVTPEVSTLEGGGCGDGQGILSLLPR